MLTSQNVELTKRIDLNVEKTLTDHFTLCLPIAWFLKLLILFDG